MTSLFRKQRGGYAPATAVLLLALWFLIVKAFAIPSYLFPSPVDVFLALWRDLRYFASHTGATALEAMAGLLIALACALAAAAALATSGRTRSAAMPFIIGLQSVPIVATAPIVVLWFGAGFASKAVMAAVLCWFPAVIAATRGFLELEPNHVALFDVYQASSWDRLVKLRLPSGITHMTSGIRVSAGLAMIGAIVAEYVGADRGLGYVITQATYRLDTDKLFAAVFCAAISGVIIAQLAYTAANWLFRSYLRR